jgi:hypothetical protein
VAIRQHEKSDKFPLEDVAVSIQRKVRRMRILSRVNIWTVVGVIFANSNGRAMLQAPLPNSVKVPYLHADGVCVDLLQSNVSIRLSVMGGVAVRLDIGVYSLRIFMPICAILATTDSRNNNACVLSGCTLEVGVKFMPQSNQDQSLVLFSTLSGGHAQHTACPFLGT